MPYDRLLTVALSRCRGPLLWISAFSLVLNILTLTSSLYMMQVFDRVLASGSLSTLLFLTLAAAGALALMAMLDFVRSRILSGLGEWIERRLGAAALERSLESTLSGRNERTDALRDLEMLRSFFSGGLTFLFDAPWVPIYIAVIYLLHPVLGHTALGAAVALFSLALANNALTSKPLAAANTASRRAMRTADAALRNAEAVEAMDLMPGIVRRWEEDQATMLENQASVSRRGALILDVTKFLRQMVQIAILGLGAWLVVRQELTGGAMIAGSIILSRALQPVEQAIGGWKQVSNARAAHRRLKEFFDRPQRRPAGLPLPAPTGRLVVDNLFFRLPAGQKPILKGVSFDARPGEAIAVIGPSAAGKSTLARLLVGLHPPTSGTVRLDGAEIFTWRRDEIGGYLGYLPQDVELFSGTIAENIARLREPDASAVVTAAQLADCHDMILQLPRGYDTEIGEGGAMLSGGQRQRVGLARALYGNPRLVVLDEPNASLDIEGDDALNQAIATMKKNGTTVVVIGHRPSTLSQVDRILVLRDGRVSLFGPRTEVIDRLKRQRMHPIPPQPAAPQQMPSQSPPARIAQPETVE
ncbi:type I secretion system permease/ATPase [Skermanella rosea]|uniref:type I secretion system permease/ATPase n=1 Tax=Skermanella rosea TaxID=1817965 RepID=UPI0019337D76|nr:type I secretion system permease/ATPase [Skermanella rosea]UEM02437.1 type I secretion system permease/ATPase [Skermanella rosea]